MKNHFLKTDSVPKVFKTRQEMSQELGICSKTFQKLLLKHEIKLEKGLIAPLDQKIIYEKIGFLKNFE